MLTLNARFSPDDGSEPRAITLRLGDPIQTDLGWSVLVELVGFDEPYAHAIYGEDWAQAIELAARYLPIILDLGVREAGGTIEPSFYERDPQPPDLSQLPPDVVEALSGSTRGD